MKMKLVLVPVKLVFDCSPTQNGFEDGFGCDGANEILRGHQRSFTGDAKTAFLDYEIGQPEVKFLSLEGDYARADHRRATEEEALSTNRTMKLVTVDVVLVFEIDPAHTHPNAFGIDAVVTTLKPLCNPAASDDLIDFEIGTIEIKLLEQDGLYEEGDYYQAIEFAKTPLEIINAVCGDFAGNGIYSIGANAALRAMAPYWETHLAEGASPNVISDDIKEMRKQIGDMREEIMDRISAAHPTATAHT